MDLKVRHDDERHRSIGSERVGSKKCAKTLNVLKNLSGPCLANLYDFVFYLIKLHTVIGGREAR